MKFTRFNIVILTELHTLSDYSERNPEDENESDFSSIGAQMHVITSINQSTEDNT